MMDIEKKKNDEIKKIVNAKKMKLQKDFDETQKGNKKHFDSIPKNKEKVSKIFSF